jgi:hypothetical protein
MHLSKKGCHTLAHCEVTVCSEIRIDALESCIEQGLHSALFIQHAHGFPCGTPRWHLRKMVNTRKLQAIAKTDLFILDDWGLHQLAAEERADLLEIIDDRAGAHSILITSQLPIEHWHEYLNDSTLADAILDRIVHQSHKLKLKGESLRKQEILA